MFTAIIALLVLGASPVEELESKQEMKDFFKRLDGQPLVVDGTVTSRIERNVDGSIMRLKLDEFQFCDDDWKAIEQIETLESINLRKSNVRDDDLAHLAKLPKLRGMVLNQTEVTDGGIGHIVAIPELRSLCLMDVRITRAGLNGLKVMRPQLGIGYVPRK